MTEQPETVPQPIWERFIQHSRAVHVEAGKLLWEPGEPREDTTYLVARGLVRLYHPDRKGNAVTLLAVGPGGLIGHHPELKRHPYVTGAEVLVSSTLLAVSANAVDRWRGESGAFGAAFTDWLLQDVELHLEDTYTRLELEHTPAAERVARTLLVLDRQALLDCVSRRQIADLANLTVETTVRALSAFVRAGTLASSHFTRLSEKERRALNELLVPFEPLSLPYS